MDLNLAASGWHATIFVDLAFVASAVLVVLLLAIVAKLLFANAS